MVSTHYASDLSVNDALALLLGLNLDHIRNGDFDWLLDEIELELSYAAEAVEKATKSGDTGKINQSQDRADRIETLFVDALALHTLIIGEIVKFRKGRPTKIMVSREGSPPAKDYSDVYMSRQSVYECAKHEFGIDITEGAATPQLGTVGEKVKAKTKYSEGQMLTLSMACLLDQLLTATNGDWRTKLGDSSDQSRDGFIANGKLKVSALTTAVIKELPEPLKNKDPTKATKGHLNDTMEHLKSGSADIFEISAHQINFSYRTLFALARATWKVKTSPAETFKQDCEYPPDLMARLTEDLTSTTPVSPDALKRQLNAAQAVITRLMQKAETQKPSIKTK